MKEESFKFLVGPWSSFFNSAGSGIIVSDPDPAELKSWPRDQQKTFKDSSFTGTYKGSYFKICLYIVLIVINHNSFFS